MSDAGGQHTGKEKTSGWESRYLIPLSARLFVVGSQGSNLQWVSLAYKNYLPLQSGKTLYGVVYSN